MSESTKTAEERGEPFPQLQAVMIDNLLEQMHDSQAVALFNRIVAMKQRSYAAEHGRASLAVDGLDFVGTHLAVCRVDAGGDLEPLMVVRCITDRRCRAYSQKFPAYESFSKVGAVDAAKRIQAACDRAAAAGQDLAFYSTWAVAPEFRRSQTGVATLREHFTALGVHWFLNMLENPAAWMATAVVRLKTDRFFAALGAIPIEEKIVAPWLNNEEILLMRTDTMSADARRCMAAHQDFISNMRVFRPSSN